MPVCLVCNDHIGLYIVIVRRVDTRRACAMDEMRWLNDSNYYEDRCTHALTDARIATYTDNASLWPTNTTTSICVNHMSFATACDYVHADAYTIKERHVGCPIAPEERGAT